MLWRGVYAPNKYKTDEIRNRMFLPLTKRNALTGGIGGKHQN